MERYSITMRHKFQELHWYSFTTKLCSALLCPDKTHEKDLRRHMQ